MAWRSSLFVGTRHGVSTNDGVASLAGRPVHDWSLHGDGCAITRDTPWRVPTNAIVAISQHMACPYEHAGILLNIK